MNRISLAVVLATCLAGAVHAAETAVVPTADGAATLQSAELSLTAQAQQARGILVGQAYTSVSELQRDEDGRWTGTAMKDGKTTRVSIVLPPKPNAAAKVN